MTIDLPEGLTVDEKVTIYNDIHQQLYDWLGLYHPALNIQLVKDSQIEDNDNRQGGAICRSGWFSSHNHYSE